MSSKTIPWIFKSKVGVLARKPVGPEEPYQIGYKSILFQKQLIKSVEIQSGAIAMMVYWS